jgi:hypothetical protein
MIPPPLLAMFERKRIINTTREEVSEWIDIVESPPETANKVDYGPTPYPLVVEEGILRLFNRGAIETEKAHCNERTRMLTARLPSFHIKRIKLESLINIILRA